jgi:hypothetical protein
MVTLGLLPPYSADDVKQAYLEKVKSAHPDRGGSVAQFNRIQEAYQQATQYVAFRASRMSWLASHMEQYVAQTELTEQIERWGGSVELEPIDWLRRSFGDDFSQLLDTLTAVDLSGCPVGDEAVEYLVKEHAVLHRLKRLDLSGTCVSDAGLRCLRIFSGLVHLDLRGSRTSLGALSVAAWFPKLRSLGVNSRSASPWNRLRLRWSYPRLKLAT